MVGLCNKLAIGVTKQVFILFYKSNPTDQTDTKWWGFPKQASQKKEK
jgi:hypothetical protein